jgi:hypothetical protein
VAQTTPLRDDEARVPADAPFAQGAAAMVPLSSDYRINALLGTCQWTPGSTITYSFYSDAVFGGAYYGAEQVSEVSAGIKANVRAIMPTLGTLMNLTFVEVPETSANIGRIRFMKSPSPSYAYAYYPCSTSVFSQSGDVLLNTAYDRLGDTNGFQNQAGYHGYTTLIHEIGHALGLKHPHEAGASGVTLPTQEDTHTQTVMSYVFLGNSPATMMGYDLLALHYIYGAPAKNAGATTYRFTRANVDQFSVGGVVSIAPSALTKQAIWDSSGPNTLDFSGIQPLAGGYRIDTRPLGYISSTNNYVSSPLYLVNGTVVGPNVTIAAVVTSPGNDTIYANEGANTFTGYAPGRTTGRDLIIGALANDVIDLTTFAPNGVTQTASGNDLVIDFDATNSVRIQNYYLAHPVVRFQSVVTAEGVTPFAGSGRSQTFTFRYSDSNGGDQLQATWAWFARNQSTSANSCLVSYDTATEQMRLLDAAGEAWITGAPGSAGTLQNGQCAVSLAGSSIRTSGDTLTMVVAMTFAPGYGGSKNLYGFASSRTGSSSGWRDLGDWTVPGAAVVTADAIVPAAGGGASQTFALQYSDSLGGADLTTAWVWFTSSLAASSANSCLLYYTQATNEISLLNDAGTAWTSGAVGANAILQNSQCAVALSSASATANGGTLTIQAPMTFKPAFAGVKNLFLFAASSSANSGWEDRGDWTVPLATITGDSITPPSGQGFAQSFTMRYVDASGAGDLQSTWVWFAGSLASAADHSCLIYYVPQASTLFLLDDTAAQWLPGTVGTSTVLQNGQCAVNLASSSASLSGNDLILTLAMTFRPSFAGAKNAYLYATGASGSTPAWTPVGTWTIPAGTVTANSATPNAGTGSTQTFGLSYSDAAGFSDLSAAWLWVTPNVNGSAANSCLVYVDPATRTVNLLNDAGTTWVSGAVGVAGLLTNGQCGIDLAASDVTGNGVNLQVTLAMTFNHSFAGTRDLYMFASGAGWSSGWQDRGSWTIT